MTGSGSTNTAGKRREEKLDEIGCGRQEGFITGEGVKLSGIERRHLRSTVVERARLDLAYERTPVRKKFFR